jgi:hypothetical protein
VKVEFPFILIPLLSFRTKLDGIAAKTCGGGWQWVELQDFAEANKISYFSISCFHYLTRFSFHTNEVWFLLP